MFTQRTLLLAIGGVVILFVIFAIGGQLIQIWLNVNEFGDPFVRPITYVFVGGLVLSMIALVRLDFVHRRSLTWWIVRLLVGLLRYRDFYGVPVEYLDFKTFRLSTANFLLWQVTKALLGIGFFQSPLFGMAVTGMTQGWNSGLEHLPKIFTLPFAPTPFDDSYAREMVALSVPALTLIIAPVLSAIGTRLLLLVGLTVLITSITSSLTVEQSGLIRIVRFPLHIFELLVSLGLFWLALNQFFPRYIDYNTKFVILGLAAGSVLFAFFGYLDSKRPIRLSTLFSRPTIRIGLILLLVLSTGSMIQIQNSIADARKVEWKGPFVVQEVSVNRYLAQLDEIREVQYDFSLQKIASSQISSIVSGDNAILKKIRLWDWDAAFSKLKPQIGLIPYVNFEDSDILRFNGSLYWSASMKPILPTAVEVGNIWYNQHLVYTHVPDGFLVLDTNTGEIVDSKLFFNQRRIYYGEAGLFEENWAAYPVGRQVSDEVTGYMYEGTGGINVSPPLSWIFDPTFLLSYPDRTIHVIRYRDVFDRVNLLFPFFQYIFKQNFVDMFPVTDGKSTYWLIPLIINLDTEHVPWSNRNTFIRFFGYALVNVLTGEFQLLALGDDFFTKLILSLYGEQPYISTEIPEWLRTQTRYPEELLQKRVERFNFYHLLDPVKFIQANEFYEIPKGLQTYYVIAQPPQFDSPEFLGLLSLQLRGSLGENLAGYMVVRNDFPTLGEMIFYRIPVGSDTKMLGPTAALQALERDLDFRRLRTLLSQPEPPRIGENILYRIESHDVYFIPVYTAPAGGVVAQLGTIAVVGAIYTGQPQVGIGLTPEEAFRNYLLKVAGEEAQPPKPEKDVGERENTLFEVFKKFNVTIRRPEALSPVLTFKEGQANYVSENEFEAAKIVVERFINEWVIGRGGSSVLYWKEDTSANFGIIINLDGITELHHVRIDLGG